MGEENNAKQEEQPFVPPPPPALKSNLDPKWDAFIELGARRFAYATLIGGFAGLLLFRSPVTRWAATTFGSGLGLGSAYTECSLKDGGYPGKSTTSVSETPISKVTED